MKIAVLGDTHFGYRVDSEPYIKYITHFYKNNFIPYLLENNITTVVQTGDIFDHRKWMHVNGIMHIKELLLNPLKEHNIELITYSGNHDLYHKNTSKVYLPKEFLSDEEYPNLTMINNIMEINDIAYIPWINDENMDEYIKFIQKASNRIIFGHFEFSGFDFLLGVPAKSGMSHKDLSDIDLVISGHYHHKSKKDNVVYVGAPYEMSWGDCDDPKGFHILDTETLELDFIENDTVLYKKIYYKGDNDEFDCSDYTDCFVKIIVVEKKGDNDFDDFCDAIYAVKPHNVSIVDLGSDIIEFDMELDIEKEDTITTLMRSVDETETVRGDEIKKKLNELHVEVLSQQYE